MRHARAEDLISTAGTTSREAAGRAAGPRRADRRSNRHGEMVEVGGESGDLPVSVWNHPAASPMSMMLSIIPRVRSAASPGA